MPVESYLLCCESVWLQVYAYDLKFNDLIEL